MPAASSTPLPRLQDRLPELLATLSPPGEFCCGGRVGTPLVRIRVVGVGTLGLPVAPAQAAAILQASEPAPYGLGEATVLDPAVRRCGQIAASHVEAEDPRWTAVLATIVHEARRELGVPGPIRAELYKLLVYAPGDFFTGHRDSEKADRMFGTLVVALPSAHSGGDLQVRHAGREVLFEWAETDPVDLRWAAFYADCQHEVRPLHEGFRVVLIYNLIREEGGTLLVPDSRAQVRAFVEALSRWDDHQDAPPKLVIPLAHRYSIAELAWTALKNEDAALGQVLSAAAAESGCEVRLGMVTIQESGAAEPRFTESGRWGRWEQDPNDFEVIEVSERSAGLGGWIRPDGHSEEVGFVPLSDEDLAPPDPLADEMPDEQQLLEATGNEGCSFERTYRRAALVVWPRSGIGRLAASGCQSVAVTMLEAERTQHGDGPGLTEMAEIVVRAWPRPQVESIRWRRTDPLLLRLLAALRTLADQRPLVMTLTEVVAAGAFAPGDEETVSVALLLLAPEQAASIAESLATHCSAGLPQVVAALLRRVAQDRPGRWWAGAIVTAIGAVARASVVESWNAPKASDLTRCVRDLAFALGPVGDPGAARAFAEAVLSHPGRFSIDEVLIAALSEWPTDGQSAFLLATAPIRAAALAHLRQRAALPLAPPPDAARGADALVCSCGDCNDVRRFMADRVKRVWTLKALKAARRHVENSVQSAQLDLAASTDTRGSPQTLVLTKTEASYQRAAKQRREDLAAIRRLELGEG